MKLPTEIDSEFYRLSAAGLRDAAMVTRDPERKKKLLALVESYETMAHRAEKQQKSDKLE
jgi:hypothetical protein